MDDLLEGLIRLVEESGKTYDIELIKKAYMTAALAHLPQKRMSGEPYITHPIEVTKILLELGMDTDSIVAALLHDVVEDTYLSIQDISKGFGETVAKLVGGVTKLGKIPFISREEQQAENLRKMLLAMSEDVRVIIIKLADRLHNMRTLSAMSDEKCREKSLETMEVYAPLAHRLGMTEIKEELEDLSLQYLDPVAFGEIQSRLASDREQRLDFLDRIKERISERVKTEYPDSIIKGRVKSIYGIYRKVYIQGRSFEEIFDIYAVRIIVNTVNDCYNILGIIHDMFRPIPNRFKDYISTPKANMYQSLHTTVIDKEAVPFEIQIRTREMDYTAEYGIAAHWKYKAGIEGKDKLEEYLVWIRQFIENQQESEDAQDIVMTLKTDIAQEEVFVFTPKGDVISLPAGSTIIDFAYAIHSAVGNRMIGAKMDGRMVSIDTEVVTGKIVEIITTNSPGHGPSRDWLKIARTTEARNKIRAWFKKERREENIVKGRTDLEKELRHSLIDLPQEELDKLILDAAKRQHMASVDDLYAAIGYGGVAITKIMPRMLDDYRKNYRLPAETGAESLEKAMARTRKDKSAKSGVIVEGMEGCLVKFARCCTPLPGDEIIGFITRGYGVSIHKKDCLNVVNASLATEEERARWVDAQWADTIREIFDCTLYLLANERSGVLADVSIELANMRIPIRTFVAKELKNNQISIQITVSVADLGQLTYLISALKKIQGVISIERRAK